MDEAPGASRLGQGNEDQLVTRVVGHEQCGAFAVDLADLDLLVPVIRLGGHVDARHEPLAADAVDGQRVFAASRRRQHARKRAHVCLLDSLRGSERRHVSVGKRAGHERVPDLARASDAEDVLHRGVVGVADPYACDQVRRIADDPRIAVRVSGACLDRGGSIRQNQRTVGAIRWLARLVVRQDRRDLVHQARVCHLAAVRPVLVQHLTARIGHLEDRCRIELAETLLAAVGRQFRTCLFSGVGENRVGVRQVQELDLAAAECHRQAVAFRLAQVLDPEAMRGGQHLGHGHELERFHGGDVAGLSQRLADGERAGELVVEVVGLVAARKSGRNIPQHRRRIPALAESSDVGERLQRRAWLAQRQRHVDLAVDAGVVEVDRPEHGQDFAATRLDRHQGGVRRVALSDRGDVVSGRFLGQVLQIEVETGGDLQPAAEQ